MHENLLLEYNGYWWYQSIFLLINKQISSIGRLNFLNMNFPIFFSFMGIFMQVLEFIFLLHDVDGFFVQHLMFFLHGVDKIIRNSLHSTASNKIYFIFNAWIFWVSNYSRWRSNYLRKSEWAAAAFVGSFTIL